MIRFVNDPNKIDGLRVIQDPNEMEEALKNGESFYHWEYGDSLSPLIESGEYVKITPCDINEVKRGDCVFCVIEEDGMVLPMVHQVWEISDASHSGELWFKIGSTHASIYGWTKKVYGIAKGTNIFHVREQKMSETCENFEEN